MLITLPPHLLNAHSVQIIKDQSRVDGRPGATLTPFDFEAKKLELVEKYKRSVRDVDVCSAALYPDVFREYREVVEMYGDVSVIPTRYFLAKPDIGEEFSVELEEGVTLIIKYLATGPLNAHTGKREVFFELNGESRAVGVVDKGAGTFSSGFL